MAITSDRLAELEEEYADAYRGLENPLKIVPPELLPYLPESVQENIKMGDQSYVRREDYEGMIALAEDEKAAERAKLNDPDARGFGDTRDPEHTPDASTGSTKQHELTHWRGLGLGRRSYDKPLADQSIVKNRLPLLNISPLAEEHLYIAATQKPSRVQYYRDQAGLGDLPDKEFDAYLQLIIDEYSKLPDPKEMVRGQAPRSTYQYDPYIMPGHELYPVIPEQEEFPSFYKYLAYGSNYPYEEYVPGGGAVGYYDKDDDEIVYPLEEKDGGPLYAAEGESLDSDRLAELEEELLNSIVVDPPLQIGGVESIGGTLYRPSVEEQLEEALPVLSEFQQEYWQEEDEDRQAVIDAANKKLLWNAERSALNPYSVKASIDPETSELVTLPDWVTKHISPELQTYPAVQGKGAPWGGAGYYRPGEDIQYVSKSGEVEEAGTALHEQTHHAIRRSGFPLDERMNELFKDLPIPGLTQEALTNLLGEDTAAGAGRLIEHALMEKLLPLHGKAYQQTVNPYEEGSIEDKNLRSILESEGFQENLAVLQGELEEYMQNTDPVGLNEGGPTDRLAEIQDEENLQDEENWGTKTAEILMGMLPSEEKSWGENLFDIATLAVPPAKALKLGKLAKTLDPVTDTGIMQMARMPKAMKDKLKQYGSGVTKPGYTKIRGGGRQNTLKTRSPDVWAIYRKVAQYTKGGSRPDNLTPETVEQLRAIMPQLRAAASSQTRHGRSTMNNVVRMFDENFYVPRGRPRAFDFSRIRTKEFTKSSGGIVRKFDILDANGKSMGIATSTRVGIKSPTPDTSVPVWKTVIKPKNKQAIEYMKNMEFGKWDPKTKTFIKEGVGLTKKHQLGY